MMRTFVVFTISMLGMVFLGCENRIVPRTTLERQVDDPSISSRVKAALLNQTGIRSADISIQTFTGTVTLRGSVPSKAQLQQILQIVSSVKGVKSIYNRLIVKQTSTRILVPTYLITV